MTNQVITKQQPIADGRVTVIPAANPEIIRKLQQPREYIQRRLTSKWHKGRTLRYV